MTYVLLLVGLLFVGMVLFIRVRNHMTYCRKVAEKGTGEKIPGCPEFDARESGATTEQTPAPGGPDQEE